MILIIGGAYQGKKEYVKNRFNILNEEIYECSHIKNFLKEDFQNYKAIQGIENLILEEDENFRLDELLLKDIFNEKIIIGLDMSQGVVPIDKNMRKLRRRNGELLSILANQSKEVIRVFCGIGRKIK